MWVLFILAATHFGNKQGLVMPLVHTERLSVGALSDRTEELTSLVGRLEALAGTTDKGKAETNLAARISSLEDVFADAEELADSAAAPGAAPESGQDAAKEEKEPLVFGYCAPHFTMETFDDCHPARVRMGAEIRYFGKFARLLAGERPLKFIVTEADGTRPVSEYRYVPRKELKKGDNPCNDFDMVKNPPAADIVHYEVRYPFLSPSAYCFLPLASNKVPDILICVGGIGDKLKEEYRKLRREVVNKPAVAPFRELAYWEDGIFWSRKNAPVWKRGAYPLVFMWHMGE
jgi:hypothetical protein